MSESNKRKIADALSEQTNKSRKPNAPEATTSSRACICVGEKRKSLTPCPCCNNQDSCVCVVADDVAYDEDSEKRLWSYRGAVSSRGHGLQVGDVLVCATILDGTIFVQVDSFTASGAPRVKRLAYDIVGAARPSHFVVRPALAQHRTCTHAHHVSVYKRRFFRLAIDAVGKTSVFRRYDPQERYFATYQLL